MLSQCNGIHIVHFWLVGHKYCHSYIHWTPHLTVNVDRFGWSLAIWCAGIIGRLNLYSQQKG